MTLAVPPSDVRRPTQNVLEVVRAAVPDLRRSDGRVAALVLAEPAEVLESTIAEVAERAGVSQPTVIRFCVAVGFSGFQEFKLRLAHSLALGRPATHSVILHSDSSGGVAGKIFDYTLTSLDWARQHLDRDALDRAVDVLAAARSIEFFGYGASGIVAQDGQQKFPLFGVPCRAQSDFHQQIMTASMMGPGDVAVVISNTGSNPQLAETADVVRGSGGRIIGIVGAEGLISARCDVSLLVETLDNTSVYTPTISRIAALVIIDILSTAVAMRRGADHIARIDAMKRRLNAVRSGQPGPEAPEDSPGDGGGAGRSP